MAEDPLSLTGGCQCGAIRYRLSEAPESTLCHCRMCQKAAGSPFAAFCKVKSTAFAWTRGTPASYQASAAAERHFCPTCGTPLTFHYLDGDSIEVTTATLDDPAAVPPTINFGIEARLPWIGLLAPGRLPDKTTAETASAKRAIVSRQHPDHETGPGWTAPN